MADFNSILGSTGGAITGGALGTLLAPGVGTIAGAAIGGLGGGLLGSSEEASSKKDTVVTPGAYIAPGAITVTSDARTFSPQYSPQLLYAPQLAYIVNSPGANATSSPTKKDTLTQTSDVSPSASTSAAIPISSGNTQGTDLTQIALIAGAALVLYGFVKK